jgi:hypothetical protein
MSTAQLQTLPGPGTELPVGNQSVRIIQEERRNALTISYRVENRTTGKQQVLKIAIPVEDPLHYQERVDALMHEARVMRLLNRIEQVPAGGNRHIPLVDPAETVQLPAADEPSELPALLMDGFGGKNVHLILQQTTRLNEPEALHIASQLADALALAHLGNFQCGDIAPARLFWGGGHLTVVDWATASDMTRLAETEKVARKQDDARLLALLISWLVNGQPLSSGKMIEPDEQHSISPPLATLLNHAISNPSRFGTTPLPAFKADLERLRGYWHTDSIASQIEQDIQETKREMAFLAESTSSRASGAKFESIRKVDHLYDMLAIGKLKEPQQPWSTIEQSLDTLWVGQLLLIDKEIIAGHTATALDLLRTIPAYPQHMHRRILWRQRIIEACQSDRRLSNESAHAGRAFEEWDKGNYNPAAWMTVDQHLFEKLSQPGKDAVARLRAELWIAGLVDRFFATHPDRVDERLTIIGKLEQSVPEGTDPALLEARQHVCNERPLLETQQRKREKEALFHQLFRTLEQRVYANDSGLTDADFHAVLAEASSADDRRAVYDLQNMWSQGHIVQQWLEEGHIDNAVRHYISIETMPDDIRSMLQQQIVRATLRTAGVSPDTTTTVEEAFDRLVQQPVRSPDDLELMMECAASLLPLVDVARRQRYEELKDRKARVLENLDILSSERSSPEKRLKAFQTLRNLGVSFLETSLLRDAYGNYRITRQQSQLEELETMLTRLQAEIQSFRTYETRATELQSEIETLRTHVQPLSTSFLETEVAEIADRIPSKEAQQRHHQIWENTAELARVFTQMAQQRDFFHASGLIEVFRQRCPQNIHETILHINPQDMENLLNLATEISHMHARLQETPYVQPITQFVDEQRARLDSHIGTLLSFHAKRDDVDMQAERIVAARKLLSISEALAGQATRYPDWEKQDIQEDVISSYLRNRQQYVRRMMLPYLHPAAQVEQVAQVLDQPVRGQGANPLVYALAALLLLVVGALLVIVLQLVGDGGQNNPVAGVSLTPSSSATTLVASAPMTTTSAITPTEAQPAMITLESLPPTPTVPVLQPELNIQTSTSNLDLYAGQSVVLTLSVTDTAMIADEATIRWSEPPAGITIQTDNPTISLDPDGDGGGDGGGGEAEIVIAADEDTRPGPTTIRFSVKALPEMSPAETKVAITVRPLPTLLQTASDVHARLQQTLTITVTRNVTFRNEPRQVAATRVEVLPVDTTLTLLELEPQEGYLYVQGEIDNEVLEGWVTSQEIYTTYDEDAIPIEEYPPTIMLGNTQNPDSMVALHTSDARDESDQQMVSPQQAILLNVVPLFDPQTGDLWTRVQVSGEGDLVAWVNTEDTNYEAVIQQLAAQFEEEG